MSGRQGGNQSRKIHGSQGYAQQSQTGGPPRGDERGGRFKPRSNNSSHGTGYAQRGQTGKPSGGGGATKVYVDTKGELFPPNESLPHEKPIKEAVKIPWKPFADEQENIKIPVRTGQAKECEKEICLRLNNFPVKIKLPANIYHYVVDVTKVFDEKKAMKPLSSRAEKSSKGSNDPTEKKILPKYLRFEIHKTLIELLRGQFTAANPKRKSIGIISDRSTALYTTQQLELTVCLEQNVEICPPPGEDGRKETFRVVLSPTLEKVNTKALQPLIENMKDMAVTLDLERLDRIYNILMKNLNTNRYVPIGRSSLISFEDNTSFSLGGGLLNFKGYDTTMEIINGWKPFLNIHIANCATLLNKNVIDVFSDLFKMSPEDCRTTHGWTDKDFKLASDLLSSCKVKYFPLRNKSKVLGGTVTKVISMSVSKKKFFLEDPNGERRQISIYDYFVERYGRDDLHEEGLCLELNGKNYVPAEICEVKKGQSINRKLTSEQTTQMINCSKKSPDILQSEIEKSIADLDLLNDTHLQEFGVSFKNNVSMLEMSQTRKLAEPFLCYSGAKILPTNGVWDNIRNKAKFLKGTTIKKWGILYTCRVANLSQSQSKFVGKLIEMGKVVDVQFTTTAPISFNLSQSLSESEEAAAGNIKALTNCFQTKFKDCEIVVVVIPGKICHIYGHVKQAAELEIGMLTQCVTATNFNHPQPKRADSIVGNILLKINSKLGGINHTVVNQTSTIPFEIFEKPVMIVGADVTHGGCDGGYSYAAVTCSIHRSGMPYMMHVQAQQKAGKGSAEVIDRFDVIMKKCLLYYSTECLPHKIIYYRDGVGQGQFPEILHTEMRNIRKACSSLSDTYQPAITVVTVQKRHKTRFFMQEDGKATRENAPPGTVVDTEIVHPTENDFFLLSHHGIPGTTVRPTRYRVLWDDSDFSADQIQQLTYYLCYMYVRCNRSVSIPAPTYYAHHAASRASVLAQGLKGTIQEINEHLLRTELNKKSPMHFV